MTRLPVEICLGGSSPGILQANLRAAREGGAQRVELCSRMGRQGLSPRPWQLRLAAAETGPDIELVVMTRPVDDFEASPRQLDGMLRELERAAAVGAGGVALGVLRGRRFDMPAMTQLTRAACSLGLTVTCHRAFDALADTAEALEILLDLGVSRLLSAGLAWRGGDAEPARLARLADLATRAAGRLELVLAGGVRAATTPHLLRALPIQAGPLSLHAWSGVRQRGRTRPELVRALVEVARFRQSPRD